MIYKITKADLIGDIADFPIEVVRKMIEHQVEQGNVADVSVFQQNVGADVTQDGFRWRETEEKEKFWLDVIHNKRFDVFFDKHPILSHYVYICQDGTKKGSDIIETLVERGGVNILRLEGTDSESIYYIDPTSKKIVPISTTDEAVKNFLKTFYTEIDVEPSIKEYTMQEIADKLGIDVKNLRIKK